MAVTLHELTQLATRADILELQKVLDERTKWMQRLSAQLEELSLSLSNGGRKAYSPAEVGKILGTSKTTINRWLQEGKIRGTQAGFGRAWIVSGEEVGRVLAVIREGGEL